jgi:outer membrane protein OmpA-like peptidoglycan-associated protein
MKKMTILLMFVSVMFFNAICFAQEDADAENCKDYPAFSRMTDFKIESCELKDFDGYKFRISNDSGDDARLENVEGRHFYYAYGLKPSKKDEGKIYSALQIYRNFETAFKQSKATIVAKVVEAGNSYGFITAKYSKGNLETWIDFHASDNYYDFTIIEKEAMTQVVQANVMLEALTKDGFIALDILFDTGKSTIKQESMALVDEICQLMSSNPSLKISIEGHTDNVGTPESNKALSDERAKAVLAAIVLKGISNSRMTAVGWGQEKPVADNRTEEGRARNRRVEIVKK